MVYFLVLHILGACFAFGVAIYWLLKLGSGSRPGKLSMFYSFMMGGLVWQIATGAVLIAPSSSLLSICGRLGLYVVILGALSLAVHRAFQRIAYVKND